MIQQGEDQETEDSVEEEGEEDDTESDLVCSDFCLASLEPSTNDTTCDAMLPMLNGNASRVRLAPCLKGVKC